MEIGKAIKDLRKKRGFTQKELAFKVGLQQGHLSRIEKGDVRPSDETMDNIAKAIGIGKKTSIYVYAAEVSDVPVKRREMFKELIGPMKNLLDSIVETEKTGKYED